MLRHAFHFPLPEETVELRAFTHGLMPKTVPAMMERFVADWQAYGVDAWNRIPNHWLPESGEPVGWWSLPEYLGDRFIAPLLGAPEGACIMQPNAHWTVQCLLSAREIFRNRKKVVMSDGDFPSVRFSVLQWADAFDLEVVSVPLAGDVFDEDALQAAIDDRTALVFLSHVGFITGEKITDAAIRRIATRAHEAGSLLAVDGYHGIGAATTSVVELDADVYFGGLLKEGCGSTGNAFVYIREGLQLTPRATGWFGDDAPFAFASLPTPHPTVRRRFLGGTTAIASLYHAVEGVRLLLDAGLDRVRADALQKSDYCINAIDRLGLALRSPHEPARRSAMIILEMPRADRISSYLKTRHIYTDSRQGRFLRLAPFVWNTMDELQRTFAVIEQTLEDGSHLRHAPAAEDGPVT